MQYPESRQVPVVDRLHGWEVADPYRWAEDLDAPETRAWVKRQDEHARSALAALPERDAFHAALERLSGYERWDVPVKRGGRLFAFRFLAGRDQPVLCVCDEPDAPARALLDPNAWSEDGTTAIVGFAPSPDGALLAYGVTEAGSNWIEWRVVDAASGETLPDRIRRVRSPGIAWAPDGDGFYYTGFGHDATSVALDPPARVLFHRLGAPQDDDAVIFERDDHPEWTIGAGVTEDGRYLLIAVSRGHDPANALLYRDLSAGDETERELCPDLAFRHAYIGHDGPTFYVLTTNGAPLGRVVAIDADRPEPGSWREVIPESDATLSWVTLHGDVLIAGRLRDARTEVERFRLDGSRESLVDLPGIGTAYGFGGSRGDAETYYLYMDFVQPPSIYRYDVSTGTSTPFHRPSVAIDETLIVEQIFATSADGTRVPAFVVRRRDVPLDGTARALLFGYGGFGISLLPWFSTDGIAWAQRGGVYAVANIRGGGEYGDDWHANGSRRNKPNCFDDFIAVAEHLVARGYTASDRLAISGGSNGGLLVGACVTRRPDLYAAAHATVGLFDMVRFASFTVGRGWLAEFGDPDDPDDFTVLIGYSPLHNVRDGTAYPAMLLTTGDHDDHVVPSHTYKFAATMQRAQAGDAPILLRVESNAGHGMGKPMSKVIDEQADVLAFLWEHTKGTR